MVIQVYRKNIQMLRYGIVALAGLIIDFGLVIFSKEVLGFHYLVSACIGFLVGLMVTYILSNMFVFDKPKGSKRTLFLLFALIGVVGLGILNLIMWLFTGGLGLNYILSKVLATIVVFMWNFYARKSLYHTPAEQIAL